MLANLTPFEQVFLGTALAMLVLSVVGGAITLGLVNYLSRRQGPSQPAE